MLIPQNTVNSLRKFSGKNKIFFAEKGKQNSNYVIDSSKHLQVALSKRDQSLISLLANIHGYNLEDRGVRKIYLIETKADPRDRSKLINVETPLKFRWIEEGRTPVGLEIQIGRNMYKLLQYKSLKNKIIEFLKNNPRIEDDEKISKEIEKIITLHHAYMKVGR